MEDLIIVVTHTHRPHQTEIIVASEATAVDTVAGLSAEEYRACTRILYAGRFWNPQRVLSALKIALQPNCSMRNRVDLRNFNPQQAIAILDLCSKDALTPTIREEYERRFCPEERHAAVSEK